VRDYGIPPYDAGVLSSSRPLADYYEEVARQSGNPKAASNWVMGDLLRFLNEEKREIRIVPSPRFPGRDDPSHRSGTISARWPKKSSKRCIGRANGSGCCGRKGNGQITDEAALSGVIAGILEANPNQLAQYRSGRDKLFGYFVGQS
jgi:aspartyl-tRNA(Asn)/glutamyl-tRNA(Gln) amidotransferase subunit B